MADFLEAIETIRAEEASTQRLFSDAGRGMRSARGTRTPQQAAVFSEALGFIGDVFAGKRRTSDLSMLAEAMSTDDFANLFGDIIDRVLLSGYQATPTTYRNYCKIGSVRDFRTVKRLTVDGGEAVLTAVGQLSPYPEAKLVDGAFTYAVGKYGRAMPFSWETIVNDDLDGLKDTPFRLGVAASRTEEKFATGLFASSTGPNATFFSSGHANLLSGAPVLDAAGLSKAWTALATQTDTEGEPIIINAVHLVVPPQLYRTAETLLTFPEIWNNVEGGTTTQQLHGPNPWKGFVQLHMNSYLPIVDTTKGTTAWYLFADPNTSRPAIEVGFLRGHEQPETFMKSPNATRVGGGGLIDPMDGDFELDALSYKIRHVLGGTLLDFRAAVASAGA